jgi:hypothetical protein
MRNEKLENIIITPIPEKNVYNLSGNATGAPLINITIILGQSIATMPLAEAKRMAIEIIKNQKAKKFIDYKGFEKWKFQQTN